MTDWIDEEIEKRKVLKKRNPNLFNRITEILYQYDPMDINYGDNTDEYDPEAGTIIPRLSECSDYITARKMIYDEFLRWFYDDVGSEEEYTGVARDIWDDWTQLRDGN